MTRFTSLDAQQHRELRLMDGIDVEDLRYARLGLSELPLASVDFPICLAKDGETGRFNLIALFSLSEPRNLYWLHNRWQATGLPLAAAVGPFRLDPAGRFGLAIDESSQLLGTEGQPLFDADGRPSEMIGVVRRRLETWVEDVQAGQSMVDRFAQLQLVRPLALRLIGSQQHVHDVAGLYSLSPRGLAELADQAIIELYRAGCLSAASLMVASLNHLERLRQLHNAASSDHFINLNFRIEDAFGVR